MRTPLKKGAFFLTISSGIFMISGYLINIYLGRTLGPKNYGVYGVITSLLSFITIIQTSGITQAVAKFVAEDKEHYDAILRKGLLLQVGISVFFFIVFYLGADYIAVFLQDPALSPFIRLVTLSFPMYGLYALYSDFYNGRHFFQKQAVMNIVYSLAKAVFIILLAYLFHLTGVFVGFILAPFIALLFGFYFPTSQSSTFSLRQLTVFSLSLITFSILSNMLLTLDVFLIKLFSHLPEGVGYYTASQNIARIPYYAMSSLFLVIFPTISHSTSNLLQGETRNIISNTIRLVSLFVIPGVLLFAATGKELLLLIYSPSYLPSAISFSVLVIGMGFFTFFSIFTFILSGAGMPKASLFSAAVGVLITLLSGIFLTSLYSITGAAVATTLGCGTAMIISGIFVYSRFSVLISPVKLLKILSISLLLFLIARNSIFPPIYLPLLYLMLGTGYLGLLLLLKETSYKELVQLIKR